MVQNKKLWVQLTCILGGLISILFAILFHILHLSFILLFTFTYILTISTNKTEDCEEEVEQQVHNLEDYKEKVGNKIEKISEFLKDLVKHNEIELRKRLTPDEGLIIKGEQGEIYVSLEDYVNFLLQSLGETIAWVVDRSEKLSIFSAKINHYTLTSQKKSEEQIGYAVEIIDLVHDLLKSFRLIVDDSKEAFRITDEANATYKHGDEIMQGTAMSVVDLGEYVNYTTRYMEELSQFTEEMRSIIKIMLNMAQKTHMLSLNASIEAARAGETGKGFKIVAIEIQKFSQATTEASKKINNTLNLLSSKMKESFGMIDKTKETIDNVTSNTNTLREYFNQLSEFIAKSVNSTQDINKIALGKLNQIEDIDKKIENIKKTISDFKDQFGFLSKSAEDIIHSSEDIAFMINTFQMDNYQTYSKKIMKDHVNAIIKIFEEKISEGVLTQENIFDTNYSKIPGTNPPQYNTLYNQQVNLQIQDILESLKAILSENAQKYKKKFLACAITDLNGYTPTHMKVVAQPPNGDYDHDLAFCRDKRMFDDPVSLKSARNTTDFLLQVYMRDDGTQNMDLSMPIKIFNKHWGCLRTGYTLE